MAHFVYRCYDGDGALLYVGQTKDAPNRLAQHRSAFWAADVVQVKVTSHRTPEIARAIERRAIRDEHPRFNYQGRWETRVSWSKQGWVDFARTIIGGQSVNRHRLEQTFTEYELRFGEPHPLAEATRERLDREDATRQARWERQRAQDDARRRELELEDRRSMLDHFMKCDECAAGLDYANDCPEIIESIARGDIV